MLHIITPLSRPENLDFYYENLKDKNIVWHILYHDKNIIFRDYNWILPFYVENIPNEEQNYYKINRFIENEVSIEDENYYCFMNDDDWIEENVFEEIRKHDDDVLFISMKRGHNIPNDNITPHGTSTLIPFPGVKAGHIGLEQIVVKGKVLKTLKFELYNMADGLIAEHLQKDHNVKYLTELYALFNYLQPGRWNKEEKQMNIEQIRERFEKSKKEFRDISEHLETLKAYGDMCNTIVELGVNEGISTTAWALSLVENPNERKVYCYDYIGPQEYLKPLLQMCEDNNLNLKFELADDLKIEIPECDLLFVDTLHTGTQLRKELQLHANKAKKWIILHDTEAFRWQGVVPESEGLQPAIDDFLTNNRNWFQKQHFPNCNGLTVLERR